jgi:hypothetical protein
VKSITIELTEPLVGHEPIPRLILREPQARDYFSLGEPSILAQSVDGTAVYAIENSEIVQRYIERCLVEPKDPLTLGQLCLVDAMRVKEAVLGFFNQARANVSRSPATSSSSS